METITFNGTVTEAEGAATHLSIAGAAHFFFSKTFASDFSEPLNLEPGNYQVFVSVFTTGKFSLDVRGNFSSINPPVPDAYDTKTNETYSLIV